MNRVMLFFDGVNFYKGFLNYLQSVGISYHVYIDFKKLSGWVVESVRGTDFRGAYYYTAVGGPEESEDTARRLEGFLSALELVSGYYVLRTEGKLKAINCPQCGHEIRHFQEKEVDTQMVADMLQLAAVNAFDIAVLLSGDADFAPAVEAMRRLGKIVYVATWSGYGLASRLRAAAFGHLDLSDGASHFLKGDELRPVEPAQVENAQPSLDGFLQALEAAERYFAKTYVGLNYFLTVWRSTTLPADFESRARLFQQALQAGKVEVYLNEKGEQAIRRRKTEDPT